MSAEPEEIRRRKEYAREEVLHYFAKRSVIKQDAWQVYRSMRYERYDFTQDEIETALHDLSKIMHSPGQGQPAEPLLETTKKGLGSTPLYSITGAGLLYDERN